MAPDPEDYRRSLLYVLMLTERAERGLREQGAPPEQLVRDVAVLDAISMKAAARLADDVVERAGDSLIRLSDADAIIVARRLQPLLRPFRGTVPAAKAEQLLASVADVICQVAPDQVEVATRLRAWLIRRYAFEETGKAHEALGLSFTRLLKAADDSSYQGPKGAALRISGFVFGKGSKHLRLVYDWAARQPRLADAATADLTSRMRSGVRPDSLVGNADAEWVNPGRPGSIAWLIQYLLRVVLGYGDEQAHAVVSSALGRTGPWPRRPATPIPAGAVGRGPVSVEAARLGHRLTTQREAAGLTLGELAARSLMEEPLLTSLEAGRLDGPLSALVALAHALNISVADLVG